MKTHIAARGIKLRLLFFTSLLLFSSYLLAGSVVKPRIAVRLYIKGIIDPPMSSYVARGLREAESRNAELVILMMDTPGGLVDSMREIVQAILASNIPVVTYVAPEGARAASAGALIGIASDFLVMTPTSNIGAAHPVDERGQAVSDKITNDMAAQARALAKKRGRNVDWAEKAVRRSISATADEAVKAGVADFIAANTNELLAKLHGRTSHGRTLNTKGISIVNIPMNPKERFLHVFSNPNIALLLMMLALYGLIGELSHPGAVFPGVVGAISAILAFYSFSILSLNIAGLLLILLAIGLLIADLFLPSHGVLTLGGVVCLALGGFMLFEDSPTFLRASAFLIIAMAVSTGAFFALALGAGIRAQRRRVVTGREGLIGATAIAKSPLKPDGMVQVMGELWRASSEEPVEPGERVVVTGVDGLTLRVRKEM
ncbi:MAG: NfeD family protein [Armatimonadota bacterium]